MNLSRIMSAISFLHDIGLLNNNNNNNNNNDNNNKQ